MQQTDVVKLSNEEIDEELATLSGWEHSDGKLRRKLEFESFVEAFAFMTKIAMRAERMDHHPEWSNVYNRVEIALVTHDPPGITNLDVELARAANRDLEASR